MDLFDDLTGGGWKPNNWGDLLRGAAGGSLLAPLGATINSQRAGQRDASTQATNAATQARKDQATLDAANAQAALDRKKRLEDQQQGAYGFSDLLLSGAPGVSLLGQTTGKRPLIGG